VEPGHGTEVLRVPVALEQALDTLFDAVGDFFQPFLIFFGHSVLLSQIIELKKAHPRTGRDKPIRERARYSFSKRMLLVL
jgi:ABC-type arginine transport system permease subunit